MKLPQHIAAAATAAGAAAVAVLVVVCCAADRHRAPTGVLLLHSLRG